MGELTATQPKPLLPIDGQPMLLGLLSALEAAGLRAIEMVTGYRAEELEAAVRQAPPALAVRFHRQQRLDGTAGALLLCRRACGEEPFLLTWADVLAEPSDYRAH